MGDKETGYPPAKEVVNSRVEVVAKVKKAKPYFVYKITTLFYRSLVWLKIAILVELP